MIPAKPGQIVSQTGTFAVILRPPFATSTKLSKLTQPGVFGIILSEENTNPVKYF